MIKNEYVNEMPFELTGKPRAQYHIIGHNGFCNHGNLIESMIKYHRGLPYLSNPNTSGSVGYDVPEEKMEVKSSECGLGRDIGERDFSVSQQISWYFKNRDHDDKWLYGVYNEKTNMVTEYIMNKSEFGAFLHIALRKKQHKQSNGKSINVRFRPTTRDQIEWLENRVAMTA